MGCKCLNGVQAKIIRARNRDFALYQLLKGKARMLTPNTTTVDPFRFEDLAMQAPIVVERSAGLSASGLSVIWQQAISDTGQTCLAQAQVAAP